MNEAEWLTYTGPLPMLEYLSDRASERKARLFACASCRSIWHLLGDERSRRAIAVSEWFGDRLASWKERREAYLAARNAAREVRARSSPEYLRAVASMTAVMAQLTPQRILQVAWDTALSQGEGQGMGKELAVQSDLLRDLFGNPFRPVAVDLAWLTPTVVMLAQGMYEDRRFADLPILADALEEAGCNSEEILAHLRGPGPHVRGCWVVDLFLGKG